MTDFSKYSYKTLANICKRHKERICLALENNPNHIVFYQKNFMKPQEFMEGNKLNMFKYGEFINSITEEEIDRMSEEEITKYFKTVEFIKEKDLEFFNRLSIAADNYFKEEK